MESDYESVAVELLQTYFGIPPSRHAYTGASFETIGAPWNDGDSIHRITPADIVAVSMLSVDVPASASIALLGPRASEISALLRAVPVDLDLCSADDAALADTSAAGELWSLLRSYRGMGRTTTSKLMARKRPRLIPIFDTVVARELGLNGAVGYWRGMREGLASQDGARHAWLKHLGEAAGVGPTVTPLRVLDVVVWMHGKDHARSEGLAREAGLPAPATGRP